MAFGSVVIWDWTLSKARDLARPCTTFLAQVVQLSTRGKSGKDEVIAQPAQPFLYKVKELKNIKGETASKRMFSPISKYRKKVVQVVQVVQLEIL